MEPWVPRRALRPGTVLLVATQRIRLRVCVCVCQTVCACVCMRLRIPPSRPRAYDVAMGEGAAQDNPGRGQLLCPVPDLRAVTCFVKTGKAGLAPEGQSSNSLFDIR